MMYFLYTFISWLLLPFAFLRLKKKSKQTPAYAERWSERKGYVPFELSESIWLHSVSLGESIAAKSLIEKLLNDFPDTPLLITTTTPSGSEYITSTFGNRVHHTYFPYDLPSFWRRFILKTGPKVAIFMETELWPNLLKILHKKHIPSVLVNARMSERSKLKYVRFAKGTKRMLSHLSMVLAQTDADAKRFGELGKSTDTTHITGSLKFDLKLPQDLSEKTQALKTQLGERPTWVAGSTHEGEEDKVLAAHKQVLKTIPNALLLLVPRHKERFDTVFQLCEQQGFKVTRRSDQQACSSDSSVFLGDSLGEMMLFYGCAQVAFVGGSLASTGGHNLLEPAALKKPGLTGPNFFNFQLITDNLIKANAVSLVMDENQLSSKVTQLLQDPERCEQMGSAGQHIVDSNRGALDKQYALIKGLLQAQ